MNKLITSLVLCLICTIAYGQKFEGGVLLGASNYHGDLVEGSIEIKETHLAFGFFTRYNLNDDFSLRANIYGGKISGKDSYADEQGRRDRNIEFESFLYEVSIYGEWYFLNRIINRKRSDDDRKAKTADGTSSSTNSRAVREERVRFSPYAFAGLSLAYVDPSVTYDPSKPAGFYSTEEVTDPTKFAIPLGLGLQINVGKNVDLGLEMGFRTAFTDMIDGVEANGNPDKNDWYMFGGISASFFISDSNRRGRRR